MSRGIRLTAFLVFALLFSIAAVQANEVLSSDKNLAMVITTDNGDNADSKNTGTSSPYEKPENSHKSGSAPKEDYALGEALADNHETGHAAEAKHDEAHGEGHGEAMQQTEEHHAEAASGEHDTHEMATGHGDAEDHGEEHGGGHGEDPSVMSILAHHVVDSHSYSMPWGEVPLPVIPINIPALGLDNGIPMTKHMIGITVGAILAMVLLIGATGRTKKGMIPKGMGNFLEMLIIFVRDEVVYANIGEKDGKKWLPVFLTMFFLILFSNLFGMIPFGTAATGNVNITGGLAITMLIVLIVAGVSKHGIKYIATFIPHGVPWPVAIILFPIEIFGLLVKHFALCIRLFANMLAGHTIIAVFLALILSPFVAFASVPGAVAISMLELFVAFLQAYVFVMLSSLFVGAAIHPH